MVRVADGAGRTAPPHGDGRAHASATGAARSRFGLKCAVWAQPLITHVHRLDALRPRVELVSFGGAAGTLASLGDQGIAVMEGLAAELGLAAPAAPWHVSRDGFAETVAFLGLVCGSLAKLATDVILLAQTEVGEVVGTLRRRPRLIVHHAAEAQPDRQRIHPGRRAHRARAGAGDARCDGGRPRARHRTLAGGAARPAAGVRADPRRVAARRRHRRGHGGRCRRGCGATSI